MRPLPAGLVTFCFVDVEGSTRAFRSDPDGYPGALAAHHRLVGTAIDAAGGTVVETEGDGLFAAFAESGPALAGCLAAQTALADHDWPAGLRLRSRMGLHAGEAVPAGRGYVSLAVHQAARVAAAAHGGQVLCTASVAGAADGRLPAGAWLAELGRYRLKDFDEPAVLCELRHPQLPGGPPPRVPRLVPGNLRLARTSFVGRDAELAGVRALLAAHRLVTIIGPGGVGKTRLAFRLAGELTDTYEHGAWVVELDAVSDPGLVADAAARALPMPAFAGGSPAENMMAFLASRNLLLVLDNCEHVAEGAAELADRLLDAAPGVTLLATSRVPLELAGEARFALGPLPLAADGVPLAELLDVDAVRLFTARAQAVRPAFRLDQANAAAVTSICRRLDGLPLALELAASRVASLAPADLLTRLEDRLSLLRTSARGIPARQRTLHDTLAWSYELLSPAEQLLLARLSVFAGRFSLSWAEQVCSAPPLAPDGVLELAGSLVAKSLLVAGTAGQRTEYELLLTVREYAAQRLAEQGGTAQAQRRRADFLITLLALPDPVFQFSSRTRRYLAAVAEAADDVRAALTWCLDQQDGGRACALIATVYRWWNVTGRIAELVPLARRAVELPGPASLPRLFTYYALLLGLEVTPAQTRAEARRRSRDMLALARQLGDDTGLAVALYCEADTPAYDADFAASARLLAEAAAAADRAGHRALAATIRRSEAEARSAGDPPRLITELQPVIEEFRASTDPFGLAQTLAVLARAELESGDAGPAAGHAAEGLRLARENGYTEVAWRHLVLLAWSSAARGDAAAAARLLGAVDAALARCGGQIGAGPGAAADRARVRALAVSVIGEQRFSDLHAAGAAAGDAVADEPAWPAAGGG
jgi:predicted ATPase/class 3 adenylate cyclase